MVSPEEDFAQHVVEDTQLLDCAQCGVPTAHRHEHVLAVSPGATMSEVEMSCVVCQRRRRWFDVLPTLN